MLQGKLRRRLLLLMQVYLPLLQAGASCAPDIAVDAACVPCSVMHPRTTSCAMATCAAGAGTFRKTFPLYMSISLVPFVVFNTKRAMKDPANTLWTAFLGAARSTSFLASFVSIFQVGRGPAGARHHRSRAFPAYATDTRHCPRQ